MKAAEAAGAERVAALHEQITAGVEALTVDPQWRAMLQAAAHFDGYPLNNQLLITGHAARVGAAIDRPSFRRRSPGVPQGSTLPAHSSVGAER